MSQAHSHSPPPPRRQRGRSGRTRTEPSATTVPDLLHRSQAPQPDPASGRPRIPLLAFGLGLGLGLAVAGPLQRQIGPLLAALIQAPQHIASLVDPLGLNKRQVLVMGRDSVGDNTDVMFTVKIRDGITRITQVPRDTFIDSKAYGVIKANSLYAMGGFDAAQSEVSRLVGTPVDRYVKVNLHAVAKVADVLGGIDIDVPKRMYYVDNAQGLYIDLYPGRQVLKGNDLEGFLRFRHDAMGDLGRMERQRLVLGQVFAKLAQPATLTKLPELMQILGDDILTDLSPIELTQLVSTMAHTKLSTERLPGRAYWQDDLSYWMPSSNHDHPGGGEDPRP
jgi:LCP family protein required for cell wall assembly